MIQIKKEYPKDEYIELKGLSPYLIGRITIYFDGTRYSYDADIVLSETNKIYAHISMREKLEDEKEALDLGLHDIKQYMRKKKH